MSKHQIKTGCVRMVGPDTRMDRWGDDRHAANPLPPKCAHCTFPDLDFVAQPYLLAKGIFSPAETAPAEVGNFLIRERVRRILEVAVPDACDFQPTAERKSLKPAPWWLAVPRAIVAMPVFKPSGPCCSKCGEPRDGYIWKDPDKSWIEINEFDCGGLDVFKELKIGPCGTEEESLATCNAHRANSDLPPLPWSLRGVKPPPHPERWTRFGVTRHLFFSLRLEHLLRKAKVRGQLVRYFDLKPSPEDLAWVQEKMQLLTQQGLVDASKAAKTGSATRRWFLQYLKRNALKNQIAVDFSAIESQSKITLPAEYKEFISIVGPKSFVDVNETEGFLARILPPDKLDFSTRRRGRMEDLDEDSARVYGVLFAETDHGDCFVFDVAVKGGDYPVYWYDHESNCFEPFAENFAECIKRFSQKN
jgi:hypothetical protein